MSPIHKHLRRYGYALLGAAAIAGCSSSGTDNNNPGTIALALNPTSATVQQGGNAPVTATLTRGEGFTGTVNLTVTGAPTGVTAVVSNIVTTGTTTTATVTVNVDANTVAGAYTLVVHGTATVTGVTEATANFALTVTAHPAVALALSTSTPSITLGSGTLTATSTVTLTRTNFTGDVTLSVDNLPTGVTASFAPANPQSGTSSVLTLTAGLTAAAGTFNTMAVRAVGTGIDPVTTPLTLTILPPAASFTLSLTNGTLSIAQGAATPTTTVNINRSNFTGDVALSVLNLPTGVTASFAPANPQQTSSSVLTLTVGPTAPTGTFNTLAVQGVGTGIATPVTTPLTLTITAAVPAGNFTLTTTPPTSVNVTQGGAAVPVTVNINHTGGNTSAITLTQTSATALPAGLSVAFSAPNPPTGNTSTLTITATSGVAVGSYPIVIHGNTPGLGEQTVNFTINVVAPGPTTNVSASFVNCDPSEKPAWLAFQDGTGAWTQVIGVNDVYNFNVTQSKGGLAWVTSLSGSNDINVQYSTLAELTTHTLVFCSTSTTPTLETSHGTVSHLLDVPGRVARISFGGGFAIAAADGPFTINAGDGTFDLIAYARLAASGTSDAVFISRGENPVAGGNFAQTVNFADPVRASSAAASSATVTGVGGDNLTQSMSYLTGTACTIGSLFSGTAGGTFTLYGVPASLRVSGDLHLFGLQASNTALGTERSLIETFVDVSARAASPFILPANLPTVVATDAGGSYKRPQIVMNGVPAEFNQGHSLSYQDQTINGRSGNIFATQGWVGGSNVTLVLPNFHGVGTFLDSYAPATTDNISYTVTSSGGSSSGFTTFCTPGLRQVSSSRTGSM